MIIIDDGDMNAKKDEIYRHLQGGGHIIAKCHFDAGFGYKSNVGIKACERPYLLIGSDDFNFHGARPGMERMSTFLDDCPEYSVAGGDVVGGGHTGRYEFFLVDEGSRVTEVPIPAPPQGERMTVHGCRYFDCDLTRNYCLIRREILGWGSNQVHWDDDVKIGGGEHGAFFTDVKRAGHRVAFLPDSQISEQAGRPTDRRYPAMRARARRPQRECFEHRGILEWKHTNPNGSVGWDYDARNGVPK